MKISLFLSIQIISILFFNGCAKLDINQNNTNSKIIQAEQVTKVAQSKIPSWMDDPQKEADGKTTAVGCAGRHINGVPAQKKLALQRAIDEIAMQKKTKVQTVTYNTKAISGSDKTSKMESSSLQETDNADVSVAVMEYYTKPDSDICVWVIEK